MMQYKKKICAVIVTYNRKDYLKKLLISLKKQSYKLNSILIFDNFSSDGTSEMLLECGFINECATNSLSVISLDDINIFYYRNNINIGGSGGFHNSMKIAFDMNCFDFLWCMDDDVLPDVKCLENLLMNIRDDTQIAIPNRTGNGYFDCAITDVNLTKMFCKSVVDWKSIVSPQNIKNNVIQVEDMAFEGPLISTKLIEKIGLPNENLFILFDDSDYAMRASTETNLVFVKNAILLKQIIPSTSVGVPRWKEYYNFRNAVWFTKKYCKSIRARWFRSEILCMIWIVRYIADGKFNYARTIFKAYWDGINRRMGKTVDPVEYK